jgi:HSP20 family protein
LSLLEALLSIEHFALSIEPVYDGLVAFARWDPVRDLLAIQQRLDRFKPGPSGWVPPIDLHETASEYVLTAELPGLRREDLTIQLQDGRLTLAGSRRDPSRPCEQYHRVERGHGTFSRTFQLPQPVNVEQITADLSNGVLTVTCPKVPEPESRRIRIS